MSIGEKYEKWKKAIKNTPPDRLLRIKMQGYVLQSIGILVVSVFVLLYRTEFWWIILVFIFSLWQNYSGFVSTWKQYDQFKEMKEHMDFGDDKEKSPHKEKVRTIKENIGKYPSWIAAFFSVIVSYLVVPSWSWYIRTPIMVILIGILYYILYFIVIYKIAERKDNDSEG